MVRVDSIIGLSISLLWALSACQPSEQGDGSAIGPLIEVGQLSEILEHQDIKLVDLRPFELYQKGHIPKAIHLWRPDIQDSTHSTTGIRASRSQLQYLLQSKGFNHGDHIVIYDDKGDVDAARLWWLLKLYGYHSVSLLNGGLQAWENSGLEITNSMRVVRPNGNIQLETPNHKFLVDHQKVLAAVGNKNYKIIDARSAEEYSGQHQKSGAQRSGRIPGSIFFEYSQTLDENAKFLESEELIELISSYGISAEDSLIVYCQSGVRSSHLSFVLHELMDYPYVANYDGSWIEWSQNPNLPIETDSLILTMN
ncbi:MAG: sulfurtransferase [Cyclobacteriaceae bacterium]